MLKSEIHLDEEVDNTERKFGEVREYFPVKVISASGLYKWAMFTESEIDRAIIRADKNREDIPKSVWEKIFG